jgi:hypothetical protein
MSRAGRTHTFAFLCLVAVACHTSRSVEPSRSPALWGGLPRGPHDVGLTQLFARDIARPSLTPGGAGREVQIVIWYPAERTATRPLALRDYVEVSAGLLGSPTDDRRRELVERFAAEPLKHGHSRARIDSVLSLSMAGVLDAPHGTGRFPLVVFLHAAPWTASVMSEYLASHGFVVAAIESKGVREVPYRLSRENLEVMTQDAAFVIARMRREDWVAEQVGIIGMSNGSIAGLGLQLIGPTPAAVVSLDGGIGERAGGTYLAEQTEGSLTRLRSPLLHLYTPDNSFLDFQYIRSYESMDRTLVRLAGLRHADFLTYAALERVMPNAYGPAPRGASAAFETICRYTLSFLRSRLAGAREESVVGPEGLVSVERIPAVR